MAQSTEEQRNTGAGEIGIVGPLGSKLHGLELLNACKKVHPDSFRWGHCAPTCGAFFYICVIFSVFIYCRVTDTMKVSCQKVSNSWLAH